MDVQKLKAKKTWAPLVASGALVTTWATGTEVSPEQQAAVVDSVVTILENLEAAYLAGAALLGSLGLWNAAKS